MARPEKLIRGNQALADFLGVCRSTIEKLNKKGVLDAARYKIGKRNGYDADKVLQILKY